MMNNSQITFDPLFYNANVGPLQILFREYMQPYDEFWYPMLLDPGSQRTRSTAEYRHASGISGMVLAMKEVIVSTGAIQMLQLLMLSGISLKAILDKFNIPTHIYNDGVGQCLQDHPSFYINIEVHGSLSTSSTTQPPSTRSSPSTRATTLAH